MAKTNAKTKTTRKTTSAPRRKKAPAAATRPARQSQAPRRKPTRAAQLGAPAKARSGTKQAILIERLRKGATIAELTEATGWQAHSVRGAISGALKKKLGLAVTSEKLEDRGRVYRITAGG